MGESIDLDRRLPPFARFSTIERLQPNRSGRASAEHARHQLYVGRDRQTRTNGLIKVTTKPGLVYQQNLANEIATLTTITRELPHSPYFPALWDHGRLPDGRVFVIMSLFDEWPLATTIGPERMPQRLVAHIRAAIEVASALGDLHRLQIVHVDLNPMNILYRAQEGRPVIRLVDFESSYEAARHGAGAFYDPPTTTGFSAPEVPAQAPDARSDLFSLGAVLYTMLAGYDWTWEGDLSRRVETDGDVDPELKSILLTAVARDPAGRYGSAQALQDALAAYLESIWPGRAW